MISRRYRIDNIVTLYNEKMNVWMKKYSVRLHTRICLTVNTKWMNIKQFKLQYNGDCWTDKR